MPTSNISNSTASIRSQRWILRQIWVSRSKNVLCACLFTRLANWRDFAHNVILFSRVRTPRYVWRTWFSWKRGRSRWWGIKCGDIRQVAQRHVRETEGYLEEQISENYGISGRIDVRFDTPPVIETRAAFLAGHFARTGANAQRIPPRGNKRCFMAESRYSPCPRII